MIKIKTSSERGYFKNDWLESYHSFSFAEYYDAQNINFGPLRVMNEDFIAPGGGFPTHPHENMEIITYVLSGGLEHKDSMGTHEVIRAGEIQKMSAGKGIYHSEFNESQNNPVHLFQMWIIPNQLNIIPSYDQRVWDKSERLNKLLKVASSNKDENAIHVHQDVFAYVLTLEENKERPFENNEGRGLYIHVIDGNIKAHNMNATKGDALLVTGDEKLAVKATSDSELIIFEVKMNFKQNNN